MLIFDAHLDLSMNAMEWNRDLTLAASSVRAAESGMSDRRGREMGTVTFPEMRRGEIGICVGTLIAPCSRPENPIPGWHSPEAAWAQINGQLAYYRAMESAGEINLIHDAPALAKAVEHWTEVPPASSDLPPIGVIVSLEGADPILNVGQLEELYAAGLRALGPAHYGAGRYANGTNATGGLPPQGRELIKEMDRLGIILDVTHLCDDCFWEALDIYDGTIWASHSNCRELVPHNRQFNDEQLKALFDRNAVIGAVMDAWMIVPGWERGISTPTTAGATLDALINHIDHICQLAGTSRHCGIGSDLDGGFGKEQSPAEIDTIADIALLHEKLAARGYTSEDIAGILHGNFINLLKSAWAT
ncbi:MAG: membrane dipeptidase [Verrucomicrobiae bacterium]|nr:membrane dipeptidase [Verrucomicrobiae bacterium]